MYVYVSIKCELLFVTIDFFQMYHSNKQKKYT